MEKMSVIHQLKSKLAVDGRVLLIYCIIYFSWGMGMNWFGQWAEIARFHVLVAGNYLLHFLYGSAFIITKKL